MQFLESANHSLESTIQALHGAKCIMETGKKKVMEGVRWGSCASRYSTSIKHFSKLVF